MHLPYRSGCNPLQSLALQQTTLPSNTAAPAASADEKVEVSGAEPDVSKALIVSYEYEAGGLITEVPPEGDSGACFPANSAEF